MCTCADKVENMQLTVIFLSVNQQPVRFDMAFSASDIFSRQIMVFVLGWQWNVIC